MLVFGPFDFRAFDPRTNHWRRVTPQGRVRGAGGLVVWTGKWMIDWAAAVVVTLRARELLLVGRVGLAYEPRTNRWRRIASPRPARTGFAAVWARRRLLVWGGTAARGNSYDPSTNRWEALPSAPVGRRLDPAVVWTGRTMIVWGGWRAPHRGVPDGASFSP